jgi:hypothetical protein
MNESSFVTKIGIGKKYYCLYKNGTNFKLNNNNIWIQNHNSHDIYPQETLEITEQKSRQIEVCF